MDFKFLNDILSDTYRKLKIEVKQIVSNKLLEYQIDEFNKNYYSKTIIHRLEPVSLDDFYIPLTVSGKSTESCKDFFESTKFNVSIIGDAGSGKSTLIKYLTTKCVFEKFKIPIKIELRYLNDYESTLYNHIASRIFNFHNLSYSEEVTNRLLSSGQFIFFLDGYDEIYSSNLQKRTNEIVELTRKFSKNKYLITSRPHAGVEYLSNFTNFHVDKLNSNQRVDFIEKQFKEDKSSFAKNIINSIESTSADIFSVFLENPLLLSLYILIYQNHPTIPQKKSEYYFLVFETLYITHDSITKIGYERKRLSNLIKSDFLEVLESFSIITIFKDLFIFKSSQMNEFLNIIKRKRKLKFENEKFLKDLTISIGIMVKDGFLYTFPHRSLQEYFAAAYISKVSNEENKKAIYEKIMEKSKGSDKFTVSHLNFMQLLVELDYSNALTYLLIVIIKKNTSDLYNYMRSDKIFSRHVIKAYLSVVKLIKISRSEVDDFIDKNYPVEEKEFVSFIYDLFINNNFYESSLNSENYVFSNFEELHSKYLEFKELFLKYQEYITKLLNFHLNNVLQKDRDIIDLID